MAGQSVDKRLDLSEVADVKAVEVVSPTGSGLVMLYISKTPISLVSAQLSAPGFSSSAFQNEPLLQYDG